MPTLESSNFHASSNFWKHHAQGSSYISDGIEVYESKTFNPNGLLYLSGICMNVGSYVWTLWMWFVDNNDIMIHYNSVIIQTNCKRVLSMSFKSLWPGSSSPRPSICSTRVSSDYYSDVGYSPCNVPRIRDNSSSRSARSETIFFFAPSSSAMSHAKITSIVWSS